MNNKSFAITIIIVVIILAVGAVGYFTFMGKSESSVSLTPIPASDKAADWKTYKNSAYGFEFQYPSNSIIEPLQDLNHQYIRLQNYSPADDRLHLFAGEYYLEIFIVDEKLGHKPWQSCKQSLVNSRKVTLGAVTGYRGFGAGGGDAGGIRFALCVERPSVQFYIQGTENDEKAPLVNPIFDSFKFIN